MAKRKQKRNYSFSEKFRYHSERAKGDVMTDNKALYSKQWLEGVNDKHAENNFRAVKSEIRSRRLSKVPFSSYDIMLAGYRNGLSSKLKK